MKSSGRNLSLTSYDDLFATDESRADADREKVMEIPLSELFPFKDHPFKVKNDEKMQETADSIREYGVLVPVCDGGHLNAKDPLTKEETCLASAMISLYNNKDAMRDYREKAKERMKKFDKQLIMGEWVNVIEGK